MDEITPRPARPEDAPAIAALVDAAYRGYIARIGRRPAPLTADYPALIERGAVWVLDGADGPRGVLVLWPEDGGLFIENIAVHPAAQGQGLGRRLLVFVEVHARALGLDAVTLYTNAAMTENLAFYPRRGYVETGRRVEDGFDRVYFRKSLTQPDS